MTEKLLYCLMLLVLFIGFCVWMNLPMSAEEKVLREILAKTDSVDGFIKITSVYEGKGYDGLIDGSFRNWLRGKLDKARTLDELHLVEGMSVLYWCNGHSKNKTFAIPLSEEIKERIKGEELKELIKEYGIEK